MEAGFKSEMRETEPKGKTLSFFELNKEEEKNLNEEIKKHDGLVRIFVHPNFEGYAQYEDYQQCAQSAKKLRQMDSAFQRILESSSDKLPPIIILHAINEVRYLMKYDAKTDKMVQDYNLATEKLGKMGNWMENVKYNSRNNNIYIVPTKSFSPDPILLYAHNEKEAWGEMIDELKSLGVKKIIIAGAELYTPDKIDMEENRSRYAEPDGTIDVMKYLGGCLGCTIHQLRENFDLELSALTFPEGRQDIKKQWPD